MSDLLRVVVGNGKYTVVQDESGRLSALRYGKPWRDCIGDKLILALAQEASENHDALELIRKATDGACDGSSLIEAVQILISQRDNARHYSATYCKKLQELGVNLV